MEGLITSSFFSSSFLPSKVYLYLLFPSPSPLQVGNITQMIAYPDSISNDEYLLNKSAAVAQAGGDYFQTAVISTATSDVENLQRLGKPVDKTE